MDCMAIPDLRYRDFSLSFHYKGKSPRIPLEGAVEVTSACNLSCRHCYIRDNFVEGELTTKEWMRIIDEVTELGCFWLTFTGGEPFLRRDFLDIYLYAKRKGLLIVLFTNATLITPVIADFLAEYKPFFLEISLYGMTPGAYQKVTGSYAAYQKCRDAILLFKERGIPFKLKSVLTEDTKYEIKEMKRFAQGLGAEFRSDFLINPRIDGGRGPCQVRVSPEEGVAMEMADGEIADYMEKEFWEFQGSPSLGLLFPCSAGESSFAIDSRGRLSICNMVRFIDYDLHKGSFKEGWDLFPEILSRRIKLNPTCVSCKLDYFCNRCPGWAMMEYQDETALIEYVCKIAHLRAKMLLERRDRNGNNSEEALREAKS